MADAIASVRVLERPVCICNDKGFTMFTSIHVSDVIVITSSEIVG